MILKLGCQILISIKFWIEHFLYCVCNQKPKWDVDCHYIYPFCTSNWMQEQFVIILKKKESISLKITCNTLARILLHPYLARGHQCIRKGTSLYTKFSLYNSLNSLFPVTLVSIDMELWLPSRMMTSTFCRFVWFVMYNGLRSSNFFSPIYIPKRLPNTEATIVLKKCIDFFIRLDK